MVVSKEIVLPIIVGIMAVVTITFLVLNEAPEIPTLEDTWWGPGNSQEIEEDTSVKPFRISVPSEIIMDLKQRLEQVRPFTPPLKGVQQHYGVNTNLLKEVVEFWKTKYNWREREKFLNQLPQFTTNIQGLEIHFIHAKPVTTNQRVLPLLILHGCSGSFREFYGIIPLLTTPQKNKDFVFEVIAPSLPGFGFSQAATKPGLGAAQMAVVFKNLMKRLGFEKYYVQGGDWGGVIVSMIAVMYPENVLGFHSNWCFINTPRSHIKHVLGRFYYSLVVEEEHEGELYPLTDSFFDLMLEFDYFRMRATKPDTLGVALKDSPVGLAAYMLEKFTTWTNPEWKNRMDGGLTEKFTYTQILDNIMIYWVTDSITTSLRIYAETFNSTHRSLGIERIPILVPSACAKFKYEIANFPNDWLREKFTRLIQANRYSVGGHFPAFEEPKLLAYDIWSAVEKFEAIHKRAEDN